MTESSTTERKTANPRATGFGKQVCDLLKEASDARNNKLAKPEYDEATWATRSFGVFVEQSIAVALQMSVAEEIATACGGGVYGVDTRPRPQGRA